MRWILTRSPTAHDYKSRLYVCIYKNKKVNFKKERGALEIQINTQMRRIFTAPAATSRSDEGRIKKFESFTKQKQSFQTRECTCSLNWDEMILISVIFPWLSFLLRGKVLLAILCALLQMTLIGWLPAAIWAVVSLNNSRNERRYIDLAKRMENKR